MTREQMIRTLDAIEADMRRLEHRMFAIRDALRKEIDPYKRRKDLGYWPDEVEPEAMATSERSAQEEHPTNCLCDDCICGGCGEKKHEGKCKRSPRP